MYFAKEAFPIGGKRFINVYFAPRWNALSYFRSNRLENRRVLPYQCPTIRVHLFSLVTTHELVNNSVFDLLRIRQSVRRRRQLHQCLVMDESENIERNEIS